ncbi:L-fuconolactonase [Aliiroseovarius halocynthiae]|uniref:Amidohydrolase family protein n=1 Tax=Aliiroseovarius halocynthiae TaxID=985055 RepID=A0A545SL83_9RHOB|nr:amidohydrolase family protein [Aliiroseovarius halocynthiae]TQV65728.1 amidohydrolase family protein [Aliiroseovarius halocynthiae]SMR83987.1 L-fuconolactonase [Aliiroseovarius halocynthiae]
MRIDAHQHFWALARGDYGWLSDDLAAIYRDFLPEDLAPMLDTAGIDGTVLVQAAPTVAETDFMLSLADRNTFIKGVVGWVDFENAASVAEIDRYMQHPAFVGLRPLIQDIADADWMLRDDLTPVFDALIARDLTFDALTLPRHLPNLHKLLARHPDMRVVIDHSSKPLIRDGVMDGWAQDMSALAHNTNAFCKLSGLLTEAKSDWIVDDLRPYVDHLLNTFGPDRLLWGSDWPVLNLAGDYARWVEVTDQLLSDLSDADRSAILGGNAARAYKLRD